MNATGKALEPQGQAGWGQPVPGTLASISLVPREAMSVGKVLETWLDFREKMVLWWDK